MQDIRPGQHDPSILVPHPPRLPPQHIPRPRLQRRLDDLLDAAPVLRLIAPAAAGKTTLLLGWRASRSDLASAYLALDMLDDNPSWFWSRIIAALRSAGGRMGNVTERLGPDIDVSSLPHALRADLARLQPLVLILDDLQNLTDPDAIGLLSQLVFSRSGGLRIVLAGRSEPPVHQGLLRARGELLELPPGELDFDRAEFETFLQRYGRLQLDPADVDELYEKTEGWTGGANLAAVSLVAHNDPSGFVDAFSGSNRYVADLFERDVLAGQTAEVRRFLLTTSVLDSFDAKLCDVVTGNDDGAVMLDHLERVGLFLEPADDPHRLRYSRLFREFLRHQIHLLEPGLERLAHDRAAAWYEAHDQIGESIRHLLASDQALDAVGLVLRHGGRHAAAGRLGSVRSWLALLPNDVITTDIDLLLGIADLCVLTGLRSEALMWLERCRWRIADLGDPRLAARLAVISGRANGGAGDVDMAIREGLQALRQAELLDEPDPSILAGAHHLLASAYAVLDDVEVARRHRDLAPAGDESLYGPHSSYDSWLSFRIGDLDDALHKANAVLHGLQMPWMWTAALLTRGGVRRERDQLEEAESDFTGAIEVSEKIGRRVTIGLAELEMSRVRFFQQRIGEAYDRLARARAAFDGPGMRAKADIHEALLWLYAGEIERSEALRERIEDGPGTLLLDVRLHVARGELAAARQRLGTWSTDAPMQFERIRATMLEARLAEADGDEALAQERLAAAIDLGRAQRFVRAYSPDLRALHRPMRQLVAESDDPYLFELLASAPAAPRSQQRSSLLSSALSARELIVLRYLPTALSNKDIAAELHMSVNTLKTHLKSINRKLGATSRLEAVQAAREADLL